MQAESCLTQDEPELKVRFSHKMSLKGKGWPTLGIDHPHERRRKAEPRADSGISAGQRVKGKQRQGVYEWVTAVLRQHQYRQQSREVKGLLRAYLSKMTGLSRAQGTRLIGQYFSAGEVKESSYRRHRFANTYTPADVELLAAVDEAHETLSGPATAENPGARVERVRARPVRALGSNLRSPDL